MKRKKNGYVVLLKFILILSIVGVNIIGCSDTQYTSSMLTPADVDKYIRSPVPNIICLENDAESVCVYLRQEKNTSDVIDSNKVGNSLYVLQGYPKPLASQQKELQ